jgi:hypothetical protein
LLGNKSGSIFHSFDTQNILLVLGNFHDLWLPQAFQNLLGVSDRHRTPIFSFLLFFIFNKYIDIFRNFIIILIALIDKPVVKSFGEKSVHLLRLLMAGGGRLTAADLALDRGFVQY